MVTRSIAITSLILNFVVIGVLLIAFFAMRRVASDVAQQLETIGAATIRTSVRISQTVPVKVNAPINQRMNVPINQQVPVNASISIEPDLPVVGKVRLDVPMKGSVPLNVNVPIVLSQTLPIDAQVTVNADLPVEVPLASTPFKAALDEVVDALMTFAGER